MLNLLQRIVLNQIIVGLALFGQACGNKDNNNDLTHHNNNTTHHADAYEGTPCPKNGICKDGYSCSKRDGSENGICLKTCQNTSECGNDCLYCSTVTHTCEFFPQGDQIGSCSGEYQQCNGQGECECTDNRGGEKCTECAVGWTGADCDDCQEGFTGKNCNICDDDFWGPNCQPCECGSLQCDEGREGTGGCYDCPKGWAGPQCDKCARGYVGDDCHEGSCMFGDMDKQTGKCTECHDDYSGANCSLAPNCENGTPNYGISGDGHCKSGSCKTGWGDKDCDICDQSHYGNKCQNKCNCRKDEKCESGFNGRGCVPACEDDNTYSSHNFCGVEWMTENLSNQCIEHYSVNGNSENDYTFGLLYTFENAQHACPAGWTLPTRQQFENMMECAGAVSGYNYLSDALRDTRWADGTDSSGFSALPAGYYYIDTTHPMSSGPRDAGEQAHFLTAQDRMYLTITESSVSFGECTGECVSAYSVRCIKGK